MKIKLNIITGPTATGKSALALRLCEETGGEIVSADSMQIYKGMSIGTAAPSEEEKKRVPHHLVGFRDPRFDYSVADYVADASRVIEQIDARGKRVYLVGGTGLYISSLIRGSSYGAPRDAKIRKILEGEYDENPEKVFEKLSKCDAESAKRLHINDKKRVVRALEVYLVSGKTIGEYAKMQDSSIYEYNILALNFSNRATLYDRIDCRVDNMIDAGLQNEVEALIEASVPATSTAMQAIGYKEFLAGQDLREVIASIKQNSRRYAKRQLTWLRGYEKVNYLYVDRLSDELLLSEAKKIFEG